MSLSQPGSAAGGAVDAPRRPEPTVPAVPSPVPQPQTTTTTCSTPSAAASIPDDPVARLLAGWVAVPARAVCTTRVRAAGTATTRTAGTPMG